MLGSSRFGQSEGGGIERRLQALENRLKTSWADRFRQGANTVGDQSAALGRGAAKLGTVAVNRIADETGRRPLFALAVAVGVGILIGMAARNSRSDLSK